MQKSLFDVLEDQKRCTKCEEWKDRDQFHKNKSKKDGLNSYCKKCRESKSLAHLKLKKIQEEQLKRPHEKRCCNCEEWKDRDQFRKRKDSKDGRRADCKECERDWQRLHSQSLNGKYSSYKKDARKRGYDFKLTIEEFEILTVNRLCKYCDLSSAKEGRSVGGVDRVVNEIGYFFDNCVPCCERCNKGKSSYPTEEYLEHVERVYNHSVKPRKMKTDGI